MVLLCRTSGAAVELSGAHAMLEEATDSTENKCTKDNQPCLLTLAKTQQFHSFSPTWYKKERSPKNKKMHLLPIESICKKYLICVCLLNDFLKKFLMTVITGKPVFVRFESPIAYL